MNTGSVVASRGAVHGSAIPGSGLAGRRLALAAWTLCGVAMVAAAAVLALLRLPNESAYSICLLRQAVDLPCPGCGLTRAVSHLAHGEWREAMRLHPLAPLLTVEAGALWLLWGGWLLRWGARWRGAWEGFVRVLPLALGVHGALLLGLWLGRLATGTLP